jgi:hypothetical protein
MASTTSVAAGEVAVSEPGGGKRTLARAPSVSESLSHGKAARGAAPRASHADFVPAADRSDPVELLERQARRRVPELVPIRYGRMLASPFAFYRGAAAIMAEDLASTPQSGLRVQCCGDAHLSNFGVFASAERRPAAAPGDPRHRHGIRHPDSAMASFAARQPRDSRAARQQRVVADRRAGD